jgi:hypothetical protein
MAFEVKEGDCVKARTVLSPEWENAYHGADTAQDGHPGLQAGTEVLHERKRMWDYADLILMNSNGSAQTMVCPLCIFSAGS